MVNVVHLCEKVDLLYTGDVNGTIGVWSLNDIMRSNDFYHWPLVRLKLTLAL